MKPKVVVASKIQPEVVQFLQQHSEPVIFERLNDDNFNQFLEELKDAQGLIGFNLLVDEKILSHAPNLKIVSTISVGYDNFDLPNITQKGILATNTPGVLNETTADTMFGLILTTARRFTELDQFVKTGQWEAQIGKRLFGSDVHHKTLGIIGMGGIGTEIAKRAHLGFDMDILYHNRSRNEEAEKLYNATYCSLEELLQQSDFVCLMTPLSAATEGMIGEEQFKLMKKSAFFINGSRGKTVDEEALIAALQNGEIAGAGLDVFEVEPVQKDNPLLKMPNVVTLPHIGSATVETRMKMSMCAAENIVAGITGDIPPNVINKELLQKKS